MKGLNYYHPPHTHTPLSSQFPSISQEQNCIVGRGRTDASEGQNVIRGAVEVIWFSPYFIWFHLSLVIWDSSGQSHWQQSFISPGWAWTHRVSWGEPRTPPRSSCFYFPSSGITVCATKVSPTLSFYYAKDTGPGCGTVMECLPS